MPLDRSTVAVHAGRGPRTTGAPLNAPLVLASSFHGSGYAREEGAPSWEALEQAIGALEGGSSVAFASGTAAAAAILETLPAGARVVGAGRGLRVDAQPAGRARGDRADRAADGRHDRHRGDARGERGRRPAVAGDAEQSAAGGRRARPAVRRGDARRGRLDVRDAAAAAPARARRGVVAAERDEVHRRAFGPAARASISTRDGALLERLRHARAQFGATPGALEAFLALRGLRTLPVRLERRAARPR